MINFRRIIRDNLTERGMSEYVLAKLTGIDRSQINKFLKPDNDDLKGLSAFNVQNIFGVLQIKIGK